MSPGWTPNVRLSSLAAVALIVGVFGLCPGALAAPGDGGGLLAEAPSLSMAALGSDSTVSFYGLQATQTITIPVPIGLFPAELRAVVELPFNLRAGSIAVSQDDRTISRVALPDIDQGPISIPLLGTDIRDNAVTLLLRTYLEPPEGYCVTDPTNPLRLTGVTIEFVGTELAPRTVADFLPPVLGRLTIFIPASPSRTESDAAVRLTTAMVAQYGKQPTVVTVAGLADGATLPPAPSKALERQIVIREGPTAAVALQGEEGVPSLLITGGPNELANQARLLSAGDLSRLALSSKAVVGPLKDSAQLPANLTTLRQLGQPGVNAFALANPQVTIGIDQTLLGRTVRGIRVRLQGFYTPLPSNLNGQVLVTVGGETIDRWPTDANASFDRWVSVPDRLLQRYTNLGVAINAVGNTGRCGESQPITLTIDGDSTIETSPADPPIPAGFQSLPQALMPRVEVGIGDDSFADTVRAAAVMMGLQRLTSLPIETVVVGLQDAIASTNPAVLISPDGWDDERIPLPISTSGDSVQVEAEDADGEPTTLTLDPMVQFGSLQTVFDNNRSVLIATSNGAPGQLEVLLAWLNTDSRRWSRLDGNVVLAAQGRDPVIVIARAAATEQPAAGPKESSGISGDVWVGAAIAGFFVLAGGLIYLRSRRSE